MIEENIFRAYDIRGIYGSELTDETAYIIGLAFGTKLRMENKTVTVVGYDNRHSSVSLFESLTKGILETGIDVINIGLATTPMYYYSWYLFKATSGIMITASHNPKEYNGFKMSFNGVFNAYGEYISEFLAFIKQGKFIKGNGKIINEDIKERYVNFILSSIKLGNRKLKIVVDAGNGTGSIVIKDVLDRLNVDYIPLFTDSNPDFPNHHPDPSVSKNMIALCETVKKEQADIGFAYDGDADRIGLVDENGNIISIDYFMIIIIRNLITKVKNNKFLFDVKCSKSLEDEIIKLGGEPICYRTGNSYLRAKVVHDNLSFAGELSGHVFFNDKFPGYDDGIYASLRMMEILSNTDKKVSELLEGINRYFSTDELKLETTDELKFELVEKVKKYAELKNYKYLDIDGCKVLFDDGFALVRASNTGPNITMRFEARTEARLNEISNEFETLLNKLK